MATTSEDNNTSQNRRALFPSGRNAAMTRDELTEVLHKIGAIEDRVFTDVETDMWHEVLGGRTLPDALTATITFYSKPFTHRAYPGDINALVEDVETERVAAVGDLELTEQDWITCDSPGQVLRTLYQQVRKGTMTREDYEAYRASGLTLEAFTASWRVPTGG